MLQDTYTSNPSQTVERIREIIVGRHFDRLEQRVAILERAASTAPSDRRDSLDDLEARIEALQQRFQRFADAVAMESDARENRHQEEMRRLSAYVERTVGTQSTPDHLLQLEAKIGQWLAHWQASSHQQAIIRHEEMTAFLRHEMAQLRSWVETTLKSQQESPDRSRQDEQVAHRWSLIAQAARALAQAAEPQPFPGKTASFS
jgi:hypothetical protein